MEYKLLIFTILSFCSCFGLVIIPEQTMIISVIPLLYYTIKCRDRKTGFGFLIIAFYLFMMINVFTCYYFRQQSPLQTIQTTYWVGFNGILVYFFLKHCCFSPARIENLISMLYLIFCFCYIAQYLIFPIHVFQTLGNGGEGLRFRMVGQLILSLGYFMELNKYICSRNRKNLIRVLFGILIFLLLGFRSMLAALVLASVFLIFKVNGLSAKTMKLFIISFVVLIPIFFLPITQQVVHNMIERQKTDNFNNEDYIRFRQWDYYTNYHFKNGIEHFLGSGIPKNSSKYGQSINVSSDEYGSNVYGWVDWGFIGLSWILGIPAVLCLLIISVKAIFTKVPPDYSYFSAWYIFLLLIGITTIEFFRIGSFIFHGLALYLIESYKIRK